MWNPEAFSICEIALNPSCALNLQLYFSKNKSLRFGFGPWHHMRLIVNTEPGLQFLPCLEFTATLNNFLQCSRILSCYTIDCLRWNAFEYFENKFLENFDNLILANLFWQTPFRPLQRFYLEYALVRIFLVIFELLSGI